MASRKRGLARFYTVTKSNRLLLSSIQRSGENERKPSQLGGKVFRPNISRIGISSDFFFFYYYFLKSRRDSHSFLHAEAFHPLVSLSIQTICD